MPDSSNVNAYGGTFEQNTSATPLNAISFVADQAIAKIATSMPVQVKAVYADTKTVDVLPLVAQIDGSGNGTPHVTVYGIPYFTLQAGVSAIEMTPEVGDIGWLSAASRDISSVKANKGAANPGSRRQFSMADGMYFGGLLNAEATQYIKFTVDGIEIVTTKDVTVSPDDDFKVNAGGEVDITSSGATKVSAGGELSLSGTGTAELTADIVQLGPGGGNIATAPAPAKTLLTNYAASGPGAVVANPTTPAASTLATSLAPSGTIATGIANLVTMGTITSGQALAITNALGTTGSAGLAAANTTLAGHTDRLSGIAQPTTATQPFMQGVIGAGAGLDYLAGGFFGPSSTAIPAASTGLTATPQITAANTYANGIVPALTMGTVTPAQVVTDVNVHAATLNAFPTNDTASYASSQASIADAGGFLTFVGNAKSDIPSVQTYVSQLMSPTTIATLKTV